MHNTIRDTSIEDQALSVVSPTVIGLTIAQVLFGVMTTQTYLYFHSFPKDPKFLKYTVLFLWILDLAHTIIYGVVLFQIAISDAGKNVELPRMLYVGFALSIFIDLTSESFFAFRLWKISKRWWMPLVCAVFASMKAATGLMGSYELYSTGITQLFMDRFSWAVNTTLASATAVDVFVAVSLSFILWTKRERGFSRQTSDVLERLIKWTVQTGVVVSVITVTTNLLFVLMNDSYVWIGFHVLLPRIYSNAVIACLNGRATLKSRQKSSILMYSTGEGEPHMQVAQSPRHRAKHGSGTFSAEFALQGSNAMIDRSKISRLEDIDEDGNFGGHQESVSKGIELEIVIQKTREVQVDGTQ